jgi:hypothetical protein
MYFKSLDFITDNQLILGLRIKLELPSTNAYLEAGEGVTSAEDLKQNPKQSGTLSPIYSEAMHTNLR